MLEKVETVYPCEVVLKANQIQVLEQDGTELLIIDFEHTEKHDFLEGATVRLARRTKRKYGESLGWKIL